MRNLLRFSIAMLSGVFLLLIVESCSTSSTMITGTWKKPVIDQNYHNILVAALVPTTSSRAVIEQQMVQKLEKKGVDASQSMDVIPPRFIEDDGTKQQIINSIRGDGVNAILTISLIDKDTESRYVPGSGMYAPYPYYNFYGNFWGYYNYWYPRFYDSGYYNQYKIYYMETNLYNVETEELIWSAQSKTYNPINIDTFSRDFAEEIVNKLDKLGII